MNRVLPALFAFILTALATAAFPVHLLAQTPTALPTADQIRLLLESSDAREQTWGAWWVAQTRARNMDALLETNLKAHLNGHALLDDAVMDATLDAMIQLGGNAPPLELLQSVYAVRPAQGLILLSRVFPRPPVDAFLLTLLDSEAGKGRGLEWFAAANLLIRDRAPGLMASLLRGLRIAAVVIVCDRGQPCRRQNLGSGSVGDGGGRLTSGLPPWAVYYLGASAPILDISGSAILASGPISITYQRNVLPAGIAPGATNYPRDSQTRTPLSPSTAERLKYVATAAPGLQIPIQDNETRTITLQDGQNLDTEVENFRQDILERYSTLVRRLRGVGQLSADEAEALAKPNLQITVDWRSVKSAQ